MPRLSALLLALAAVALLAAPADAQDRQFGLSVDGLDRAGAVDRAGLRSAVADGLTLRYAGDRPVRARMVVIVTEDGEPASTWYSDLLDLVPDMEWGPRGDRPILMPQPDIFPDGGTPSASFSSWLPWPFCWLSGCDDEDTQATPESDGERKLREIEERERRQNDTQHLINYGLQAAPGGTDPGATVVTFALIPEVAVADEGESRVQVVSFTVRGR